jgi:TatA/E family protein of Tat protein translocase
MNIMGIGPQEMMIIAVIALLVFGPGKLPEVMGQAGKLVRDFRRMSAELSGEFEKTIAEARDATAGLTSELGSMTKEVNSVTNSVKRDLGVKGTSTTKGKGATASKSGAGKSTTAKSSSSTSTTKVGGKSSTAAKPSTSATSKATTSTSTAAKKPATPVASREDPDADISLFEPAPVERPKRTRKAVPSMIADPTPRTLVVANDNDGQEEGDGLVAVIPADDALSRARQRRRNAGYARTSA